MQQLPLCELQEGNLLTKVRTLKISVSRSAALMYYRDERGGGYPKGGGKGGGKGSGKGKGDPKGQYYKVEKIESRPLSGIQVPQQITYCGALDMERGLRRQVSCPP